MAKLRHQDCPAEPQGHIYEVMGAIRCTMCSLYRSLPIVGRAQRAKRNTGTVVMGDRRTKRQRTRGDRERAARKDQE